MAGSQGGLPGIAREYWPDWGEPDDAGPGGIEGYGWGALGVALFMRHIIGLRDVSPGRLLLRPVIPAAIQRPGSVLRVGPIPLARGSLTLEFQADTEMRKRMLMTFRGIPDAASIRVVQAGTAGIARDITRLASPRMGSRTARFQVSLSMLKAVLIQLDAPD
jgi:hypothetical protein